jgi:hypothetical protein
MPRMELEDAVPSRKRLYCAAAVTGLMYVLSSKWETLHYQRRCGKCIFCETKVHLENDCFALIRDYSKLKEYVDSFSESKVSSPTSLHCWRMGAAAC